MTFTGRVVCRRGDGPACVTLEGRDERGAPMQLALIAEVPPSLPDGLDLGWVEALGSGRYRIGDGQRTWTLAARAYLHHDVSSAFYAALPPRRPGLAKRLLWWTVLTGAASRPGRWWLVHHRG